MPGLGTVQQLRVEVDTTEYFLLYLRLALRTVFPVGGQYRVDEVEERNGKFSPDLSPCLEPARDFPVLILDRSHPSSWDSTAPTDEEALEKAAAQVDAIFKEKGRLWGQLFRRQGRRGCTDLFRTGYELRTIWSGGKQLLVILLAEIEYPE